MLTTLLKPTSGEILLDGKNPVHDESGVRKSFGIVFQDPSLDDELTALENMEFHAVLYKVPKDIRRPRIEELMNFVELWDRRNNLVKEFSGGMKRRLEIARGLLHHPKILFLDEPTTGLDPQTRNHVWSYVKNLNEKERITVFFKAGPWPHRTRTPTHGGSPLESSAWATHLNNCRLLRGLAGTRLMSDPPPEPFSGRPWQDSISPHSNSRSVITYGYRSPSRS